MRSKEKFRDKCRSIHYYLWSKLHVYRNIVKRGEIEQRNDLTPCNWTNQEMFCSRHTFLWPYVGYWTLDGSAWHHNYHGYTTASLASNGQGRIKSQQAFNTIPIQCSGLIIYSLKWDNYSFVECTVQWRRKKPRVEFLNRRVEYFCDK